MFILILLVIITIIIYPYLEKNIKLKKNDNLNDTSINEDFSKYVTNNYIMTSTELKFYRELKKVTDKLELTIFSQVNMERIINVSNNNMSDRNKIKSRSIDFAIVNNKNCKIICCIELDDYTHNRAKVKKIDNFKNKVFEHVKIPLHRIQVNSFYNLEELENIIKRDLI